MTKNFHIKEFVVFNFYISAGVLGQVIREVITNTRAQQNLISLATELQKLRDALGKPITITSGYRPTWWELRRGRSGKSLHTKGMAADIKVEGMSPSALRSFMFNLISQGRLKEGGIGIYDSFIHYDIRSTKARWDMRT
jgi:uncharacterized protein YcbK (DUF882 family)